jgi:phospholipid/cholesterol/gamma-HCH transport system substrate-binding protein
MEIKANNLLIGSLVLLAFAGILGFVIWVVKLDINQEFTQYEVLFDQSVAGLSNAAEVRFNGINVGKVTRVMIDHEHPRSARVRISVDSKTPVSEDSVASLEFQGLTGVAYVQIEGGTATSKPLIAKPGELYPVIPSKPSPIQRLFSDVPGLITQASATLSQMQLLLGEQNRALVTSILKNTDTVSGGLAKKSDHIQSILVNLDESIKNFNAAVEKYDRLADTTNTLMDKDVKGLVTEMHQTTESVHRLSDELNKIAAASDGPVTAFTTNTLPEISQLVINMRDLSASLSRISERLERSPSEFLFEGKPPEYNPK